MVFLTVGQIVRLQQMYEEDGREGKVYKTRVADIDQEHVYLEIPIAEDGGKPLYSFHESEFVVMYMDANSNNYYFRSKIVGRKEGNIPLILIPIPPADEIIKTQKRVFFRVKANIDLAVRLQTKDRNFHIVTKSVDLGGGGISFLSPLEYEFRNKDQLKMWAVIVYKNNSIKRFIFDTEVVRVHPPEENSRHQIISVKFVNLRESDSALIIRYCFDRQIELHKKHEEV